MERLLDGRVALVTASAGAGIGQAIADRFAQEGAAVVVTDIHEGRVLEASERLAAEHGVRTLGLVMDVTSEEEVQQCFNTTDDELGGVDIVVNNAGFNELKPVWEMPLATWDRVLSICLTGTFLVTRSALARMVPRGRGSVVNISSIAGWDPTGSQGQSHYAAAKAGVMGFTRAAAAEAAPHGVRVNALAPGFVPNPFLERIYSDEFMEARRQQIPLGRVGEPSDIADAALFLASDLSRFIVGETIGVSGGLHMHP